MLRTPLLLAALLLTAAEPASAFVTANTIDRHTTSTRAGAQLRVTGPIGCTPGERIAIAVTVTQPATARAGAQALEGPLHRRAPALAGPGAHPQRRALRDR